MIIDPLVISPPPDRMRPRRALLSTFDKQGLAPFAAALAIRGVKLVSSGGTARYLRAQGLQVIDVAELTGFPEILGGRVKTLHPSVHGAILARRGTEGDEEDLETHSITPIDLVVVNLYPFEEAVARPGVTDAVAAENIDIGGPAMVRAAAKNFAYVAVVTSPDDYGPLIEELDVSGGTLSLATRRTLAHAAFMRTATYDQAIASYLQGNHESLPTVLNVQAALSETLRYGENPHQQAAFYGHLEARIEKLHGKALSYNNLIDLDAALSLIDEFEEDDPTVAILKHTNPCGVATATTLEEAWDGALATDQQSPFGGIVIMNRPCTMAAARAIDPIFTELIIAPAFEAGVLDWLMRKKNRRLVRRKPLGEPRLQMRSVLGGLLCQESDPPAVSDTFHPVTDRAPSDDELQDLTFAWRVAKHVKSNAIVFAKDRRTLGIGAGQMSRIDASEIAVSKGQKSGRDFNGCVVASDAFFPFADGLVAAADSGACAAVQPGGSVRDNEVIRAANARNMAMVFTGKRHFRH